MQPGTTQAFRPIQNLRVMGYLREKFGAAHAEWAKDVPALFPRFGAPALQRPRRARGIAARADIGPATGAVTAGAAG